VKGVSGACQQLLDLRVQHQVPSWPECIKRRVGVAGGAQRFTEVVAGETEPFRDVSRPYQASTEHLLLGSIRWRQAEQMLVDSQHREFAPEWFNSEPRKEGANLVARKRRPGVQVEERRGVKSREGKHGHLLFCRRWFPSQRDGKNF
jgi:hypothetical protein